MALGSNSQPLLDEVKQRLMYTFKETLLGPLTSFIGWEIFRNASGIYLTQCRHIEDFISSIGPSHVHSQPSPMPERVDIYAMYAADTLLTPCYSFMLPFHHW